MSVKYLTFLKPKIVSSVSFGKNQVGAFDIAFDDTNLLIDGDARASTSPEIDQYLLDQAALATDHGRKGSIPAGGADGEILAKRSDNDFDAEWVANSGGGGGATDSYLPVVSTDAFQNGSNGSDTTNTTYDNGASGVGATLTSNSNEALILDNVVMALGERVLIVGGPSTTTAGIYTVTDQGSGSSPWILTRATDFNTPAKIQKGSTVFQEVSDHGGQGFFVGSPSSPVIGVEDIVFSFIRDKVNPAMPLAGGTMDDGADIAFFNGSQVREGTTDAGLGGSKGIALQCSVGYEMKWEAGRLYIMEQDGFTIREVSHNLAVAPAVTDDNTLGFVVGSRWILDDGTVYVCSDATTGAAVWAIPAPVVSSKTTTLAAYSTTPSIDATYNNGTSGVGATLTGNTNDPLSTVLTGNPTPSIGERVFVNNNGMTPFTYGVYEVTQDGDGSSQPFILTRVTDMDGSADFINGMLVNVPSGLNLLYVYYGLSNPTVGTDYITFQQVDATGVKQIVAGARISVDSTDSENPIVSAAPTAALLVKCVDFTGILETGGTSGATYDNGTAGVGATLTSVADNIPPTVDGYDLSIGERVLINGGSSEYCGVYERAADVSGGTLWQITRVPEFDESADIVTGSLVMCTSSATNTRHMFSYRGLSNPVIGTDDLQFSEVYAKNPAVVPGNVLQVHSTAYDFNSGGLQGLMPPVPTGKVRVVTSACIRQADLTPMNDKLLLGWDGTNLDTFLPVGGGGMINATKVVQVDFTGKPFGNAGDILQATYSGTTFATIAFIEIMYYDQGA